MLACVPDPADYEIALRLFEAMSADPAAEQNCLLAPPAGQDAAVESCGRSTHMSTGLARRPATAAAVPESSDTSDEDMYLRRVSVLYHELWTADWIEGWPVSPRSRKSAEPKCPEPAASRGSSQTTSSCATISAGLDACPGTGADSPADGPADNAEREEATAGANTTTATAAAAAEAMAAIATATSQTTADTIGRADNERGETGAHSSRSPELRGSWASLVDAYMESGSGGPANDAYMESGGGGPANDTCEESGSSEPAHDACTSAASDADADADANASAASALRPVQRLRGASVHGFSPSDLADVLVGTVRRLEDDHTLLQHKRWSVVKELSVTEAHYLQDLLLLKAVFYEPLTAGPGGVRLRPEDAQLIFGNLDQVIECARSLVEYLTVATVYEASRCAILGDEAPRSSNPAPRSSTSSARTTPTPSSSTLRGIGGGATASADGGAKPGPSAKLQWLGTSRPASQPHAVRVDAGNTSELRNSAWADISIAQAFLLTSQRMEHVYAQYCQNFAAASRRIIELKHTAATVATAAAVSTATPLTPLTAECPPPTSSPMADHLRGWLAVGGSGTHVSGYSSPMAGIGAVFADAGASDAQPDPDGPDAVYAATVYQHITSQALCLAGKTTSWDLPSLLIKPVQRILKYPLLIRSLLGLTRTHTLDRSRLEKAAQSVERIAEAINAVHGTSGLRISTATSGSSLSGPADDGQGRVTRELRRVLRRRTGNASQARPQTRAEDSARDRLRLPSSRGRGWAREHPERLPGHAVRSTNPPTGAAALVEQHEHRIAEVIRALREWESSVGEALRQQLDVAARWHDLYAGGDDADTPAALAAPGPLPAVPAVKFGADVLDTSCAVAGALGDLDARLRQQWQLAAEVSRRTRSAQKHSHSHSPAPEHWRLGTDEPWAAQRTAHVGQYRAMLEAIHGSLFPRAVSGPLHARVYPVLNALLKVYGDGPRYILGEIARASASPGGSAAEPDGSRVARLHGVLAEDLPKLFEHERTVMRLLLVQIAEIQHGFCRQAVDLLQGASPGAGDRQRPQSACTAGQHVAGQHPGGADAAPPSAQEHAGLIRAGLWRLAQEAQRHEPAQYVVKSRHRGSPATPASRPDSVSDRSATIDDGSSVSVFEFVSTDSDSKLPAAPASPAVPAAPAGPATMVPPPPAPAQLVRRRPSTATRSLAGDFAGGSPRGETQQPARPASTKQWPKRPGGLMGRIANLRPGRIIRGQPGGGGGTLLPDRLGDDALDSIKPRPPPKDTPDSIRPPPLPPKDAPRARSYADIHSPAAAKGWVVNVARFEPLPLVDSIRFSKGFVDAAFHVFESQDRIDSETATVGPGVAPSTGAGACE